MKVYVFGNPDLEQDSLPLKILPKLKTLLSGTQFEVKDPNEDWDIDGEIIIIDTALGITAVTIFDDLNKFAAVPRVSLHDFDALTNLRYLQKLGKINKVKIIAVPPVMPAGDAVTEITDLLSATPL